MEHVDQYSEQFVQHGFDAVADDYGDVPFLQRAAESLVDLVAQAPLARALDVACGPGTAALRLASKLSSCQVCGIDVAPAMVAEAAARAESSGLAHAHFQVASALALPFEAERFDAVLCSNAIYYMPDFASALREWTRVLRRGGTLAFSTFGAGVLEPMSRLFDARMRSRGVVVPEPTPLYRLTQAADCRRLLENAGLREVRLHERQLGYWVRDETAWWQTLMSTGFQALVATLNDTARAEFESAHKREVRPYVTARGLWVDVPVIVARGTLT